MADSNSDAAPVTTLPSEASPTPEKASDLAGKKPEQVAITVPPSVLKPDRKSFQARALTRKVLVFQKRQYFTNCCCVLLCPVLMVVIAGGLAIVLQRVITASSANFVAGLSYCPKDANLTFKTVPQAINNTDFLKNSASKDKYFPVGYYQLQINPSAERFPCVLAFEPDYVTSDPFLSDPGTGTISKDSSFLPQPADGWFAPAYNPPGRSFPGGPPPPPSNVTVPFSPPRALNPDVPNPLYSTLSQVQKYPWLYVFAGQNVDVGSKNIAPLINTNDPSSLPSPSSEPNRVGFLGNVRTSYAKAIAPGVTGFYPADFFEVFRKGTPQYPQNPNEFVRDRIEGFVQEMERTWANITLDNGTVQAATFGSAEQRAFLAADGIGKIYTFLGALYVDKLDLAKASIDLTIQTSKIPRLETAALFMTGTLQALGIRLSSVGIAPSMGFKQMYVISRLSNALLASSSDSELQKTEITHILRAMPYNQSFQNPPLAFDPGVQLGKTTYPFALSFLLPIFVLNLVKEKEDRVLIMMKMHGLSTFTYYLSHFIHYFILQLLSSFFFILTGVALNLKFFVNTGAGVYIILLLVWAFTMVGLSFLISLCFNKSRPALITTFVVVILSAILTFFEDIIFNYEFPPLWYYLWPLFAFYRGLNEIGTASPGVNSTPYKMSDLVAGSPILTCILFLLFEGIIFLLMMAYLNAVLPSEYGIRKPWHFIFTEPIAYFKGETTVGKYSQQINQVGVAGVEPDELEEEEKAALEKEDDDAKAERKKVQGMKLSKETFDEYPLIIKNIRKIYSTGKIANHKMCLSIEKNIVFGLLGPNGAGKSTLIQMLTGLYPPTSGTAYVAGYDILNEMDNVYLNIGVCPQHDILWDDLTIEEHLLFYARLRGIDKNEEASAVDKAINAVQLGEFKMKLSKQLSGGQKRRLSIAISLLGDVPVVFLDEPTTGLDVDVRRTIWSIIQTAKKGKTIILTSHSMEEIDFLAAKLGIMSRGVLRCLGTPLHLKRKYGRGFKLTISFVKEYEREAEKMMSYEDSLKQIESLLPKDKWTKVDQGGVVGSAIYEFDDSGTANAISSLLQQLDEMKTQLGIEDFGISQTTLEEVFLNIVKDDDAQGTI